MGRMPLLAAGTAGFGRLRARLSDAALLRAGWPVRPVRVVRIASFPMSEAVIAALTIAGAGGHPVDLRLEQNLFLRRRLSLPSAAMADAGAAVALHLRQTMPGQAEGLVWRHAVVAGDAVDIFVLKEARLAEIVRAAPVTVRRVWIDGAECPPLLDASARTDRAERFWNGAVAALAACAFGAVLAVQGWSLFSETRAVGAARAEVAALRDQAAALRARADAEGAAQSALRADLARLARDRNRLPLLADLTGALGDGVWLGGLLLDGDVLRLSGFTTGRVADSSDALRRLPWVESVELDGGAATGVNGSETRFGLLVTLADGGAE